MDAVPQDDNPNYMFSPPEGCSGCHPNQFNEWTGSPMAQAGLNTWVHDIYSGDGTPGGMGGFVYLRDSVWAKTNPASECSSCHQPESWIPEPFTALEGPSDPGYPSDHAMHGVSCDVCHKVAHVDVEKINHPGIYPGAVEFTRPHDQQVQYGLLGDADFANGLMRPSYQPQLLAEVCGTCHQDKNDPHEDGSFDGIISEPTYIEWIESPYGDVNSPYYATCLDCHMLPNDATQACEVMFPPLEREPGTLRSHMILGSTDTYLDNSAELFVDTSVDGDTLHVSVDVFNSQVGHHLPTGVTVRNVILLVEAWRESDGEPLIFTGDQVVHDLGGVGDPAEGYYGGQPGKLFAKCNHGEDGSGPTFYTDATGIIFDTRLPALAIDTTAYTFEVPSGGGDLHVRARLIYRRAFRAFVDAKQWTEDGHGNPLEDVQAPHYGHLMETADAVIGVQSSDLNGDGVVDVSDILLLIAGWGTDGPGASLAPPDNVIDVSDLLVILSDWQMGFRRK